MKKRIISFVLLLVICLCAIGCKGNNREGDGIISTPNKSDPYESDPKFRKVNIEFKVYDEELVKSILAEHFDSFTDKEARITVTYQTINNDSKSNYVIDYIYLHNGFRTMSGYTLSVHHGVITHMRDNTIPMKSNPTDKVPVVTEEIINEAYAVAKEELYAWNPNYEVYEQSGEKFYDVETDKYYYRVRTVYTVQGDTRGVRSTFYELN